MTADVCFNCNENEAVGTMHVGTDDGVSSFRMCAPCVRLFAERRAEHTGEDVEVIVRTPDQAALAPVMGAGVPRAGRRG